MDGTRQSISTVDSRNGQTTTVQASAETGSDAHVGEAHPDVDGESLGWGVGPARGRGMEAATPRVVFVQLRAKRTDMGIGAGEVRLDWPTRPNAGDIYSNQYSNAV